MLNVGSEILEVWGDPIAHSMSPDLHNAAYRVLDLPWTYDRRQVGAEAFDDVFAEVGRTRRGLSLTMPLKEPAFAVADVRDRHATLTRVANTLVPGTQVRAFNTDVGGLVDAFREIGTTAIEHARILGAGATATSAAVALAELGARTIEIRARRPEAAATLVELSDLLGVTMAVRPFDTPAADVDATIATLPSGTVLDHHVTSEFAEHGGVLLDVAYAPWPSALAAGWTAAPVTSGLLMLLHQAVRQVRIFVHGDQEAPLPNEDAAVAAMRLAVMGD